MVNHLKFRVFLMQPQREVARIFAGLKHTYGLDLGGIGGRDPERLGLLLDSFEPDLVIMGWHTDFRAAALRQVLEHRCSRHSNGRRITTWVISGQVPHPVLHMDAYQADFIFRPKMPQDITFDLLEALIAIFFKERRRELEYYTRAAWEAQ